MFYLEKEMKRWFLYGLAGWGLTACSPVPDGILSQKEMQAVVADMQIAEAMISSDRETYEDDAQKLALYESVFRKHHITRAEYDSSLVWYARNLDIYMRVYNLVTNDMETRIDALGDVQRVDMGGGRRDSVDVWPRRAYLTFSPRVPFNGTTFHIEPKESYPPGSTFVLGMHVWGIGKGMKQHPEVRICVDQGDTTLVINDHLAKDGYHETTLRSIATKRVRRVYGYIRLEQGDSYYKIYADSISLMRYNYRSTGFKQAK